MQQSPRRPGLSRHIRTAGLVLAAALGLCLAGQAAAADNWPSRPVSVVVPFPPGGSSDMVARLIVAPLNQKLGQPFVIENRAGATGAIGAAAVKRAPADGYTMMVASIGVFATNPFLQKNLPYDPSRDFDLLTVAARSPNVLVTKADMPVQTLPQLVDHMKKNPGKVSFASSGAGTSDHLTAALFWQKTGTQGLHVPYKGAGPAMTDLLAGQVDVSFQNINNVLQHIRAGKLKVLAVTSDRRSSMLPNVPTMAEAGVTDVEVYSWQGVAAPRGLPKEVKSRLHAGLVAALNEPKVRQTLTDAGFDIVANTPEQFDQFNHQELARWKQVIQTGHITLE